MDLQKVATYTTAAAVVGTGGVKGLNKPNPDGDYRETTPSRQ